MDTLGLLPAALRSADAGASALPGAPPRERSGRIKPPGLAVSGRGLPFTEESAGALRLRGGALTLLNRAPQRAFH